jgi:Domain of unknown function (DUF1859).
MIDSSTISFRPVNCQAVPPEGAKAVPIALDFTATDEQTLDLSNFIQRNFISMVQSVYVDNKDNNAALDIIIGAGGQKVTTAPGHQCYKMLNCPNPAKFTFRSTGGIVVNIQLMNFPVVNCDWNTQA